MGSSSIDMEELEYLECIDCIEVSDSETPCTSSSPDKTAGQINRSSAASRPPIRPPDRSPQKPANVRGPPARRAPLLPPPPNGTAINSARFGLRKKDGTLCYASIQKRYDACNVGPPLPQPNSHGPAQLAAGKLIGKSKQQMKNARIRLKRKHLRTMALEEAARERNSCSPNFGSSTGEPNLQDISDDELDPNPNHFSSETLKGTVSQNGQSSAGHRPQPQRLAEPPRGILNKDYLLYHNQFRPLKNKKKSNKRVHFVLPDETPATELTAVASPTREVHSDTEYDYGDYNDWPLALTQSHTSFGFAVKKEALELQESNAIFNSPGRILYRVTNFGQNVIKPKPLFVVKQEQPETDTPCNSAIEQPGGGPESGPFEPVPPVPSEGNVIVESIMTTEPQAVDNDTSGECPEPSDESTFENVICVDELYSSSLGDNSITANLSGSTGSIIKDVSREKDCLPADKEAMEDECPIPQGHTDATVDGEQEEEDDDIIVVLHQVRGVAIAVTNGRNAAAKTPVSSTVDTSSERRMGVMSTAPSQDSVWEDGELPDSDPDNTKRWRSHESSDEDRDDVSLSSRSGDEENNFVPPRNVGVPPPDFDPYRYMQGLQSVTISQPEQQQQQQKSAATIEISLDDSSTVNPAGTTVNCQSEQSAFVVRPPIASRITRIDKNDNRRRSPVKAPDSEDTRSTRKLPVITRLHRNRGDSPSTSESSASGSRRISMKSARNNSPVAFKLNSNSKLLKSASTRKDAVGLAFDPSDSSPEKSVRDSENRPPSRGRSSQKRVHRSRSRSRTRSRTRTRSRSRTYSSSPSPERRRQRYNNRIRRDDRWPAAKLRRSDSSERRRSYRARRKSSKSPPLSENERNIDKIIEMGSRGTLLSVCMETLETLDENEVCRARESNMATLQEELAKRIKNGQNAAQVPQQGPSNEPAASMNPDLLNAVDVTPVPSPTPTKNLEAPAPPATSSSIAPPVLLSAQDISLMKAVMASMPADKGPSQSEEEIRIGVSKIVQHLSTNFVELQTIIGGNRDDDSASNNGDNEDETLLGVSDISEVDEAEVDESVGPKSNANAQKNDEEPREEDPAAEDVDLRITIPEIETEKNDEATSSAAREEESEKEAAGEKGENEKSVDGENGAQLPALDDESNATNLCIAQDNEEGAVETVDCGGSSPRFSPPTNSSSLQKYRLVPVDQGERPMYELTEEEREERQRRKPSKSPQPMPDESPGPSRTNTSSAAQDPRTKSRNYNGDSQQQPPRSVAAQPTVPTAGGTPTTLPTSILRAPNPPIHGHTPTPRLHPSGSSIASSSRASDLTSEILIGASHSGLRHTPKPVPPPSANALAQVGLHQTAAPLMQRPPCSAGAAVHAPYFDPLTANDQPSTSAAAVPPTSASTTFNHQIAQLKSKRQAGEQQQQHQQPIHHYQQQMSAASFSPPPDTLSPVSSRVRHASADGGGPSPNGPAYSPVATFPSVQQRHASAAAPPSNVVPSPTRFNHRRDRSTWSHEDYRVGYHDLVNLYILRKMEKDSLNDSMRRFMDESRIAQEKQRRNHADYQQNAETELASCQAERQKEIDRHTAAESDMHSRLKQLTGQLTEQNNQLNELGEQLKQTLEQRVTAESAVYRLREDIDKRNEELREAKDKIQTQEDEITEAKILLKAFEDERHRAGDADAKKLEEANARADSLDGKLVEAEKKAARVDSMSAEMAVMRFNAAQDAEKLRSAIENSKRREADAQRAADEAKRQAAVELAEAQRSADEAKRQAAEAQSAADEAKRQAAEELAEVRAELAAAVAAPPVPTVPEGIGREVMATLKRLSETKSQLEEMIAEHFQNAATVEKDVTEAKTKLASEMSAHEATRKALNDLETANAQLVSELDHKKREFDEIVAANAKYQEQQQQTSTSSSAQTTTPAPADPESTGAASVKAVDLTPTGSKPTKSRKRSTKTPDHTVTADGGRPEDSHSSEKRRRQPSLGKVDVNAPVTEIAPAAIVAKSNDNSDDEVQILVVKPATRRRTFASPPLSLAVTKPDSTTSSILQELIMPTDNMTTTLLSSADGGTTTLTPPQSGGASTNGGNVFADFQQTFSAPIDAVTSMGKAPTSCTVANGMVGPPARAAAPYANPSMAEQMATLIRNDISDTFQQLSYATTAQPPLHQQLFEHQQLMSATNCLQQPAAPNPPLHLQQLGRANMSYTQRSANVSVGGGGQANTSAPTLTTVMDSGRAATAAPVAEKRSRRKQIHAHTPAAAPQPQLPSHPSVQTPQQAFVGQRQQPQSINASMTQTPPSYPQHLLQQMMMSNRQNNGGPPTGGWPGMGGGSMNSSANANTPMYFRQPPHQPPSRQSMADGMPHGMMPASFHQPFLSSDGSTMYPQQQRQPSIIAYQQQLFNMMDFGGMQPVLKKEIVNRWVDYMTRNPLPESPEAVNVFMNNFMMSLNFSSAVDSEQLRQFLLETTRTYFEQPPNLRPTNRLMS